MRFAFAVAAVLVSSVALAETPPSKTLERAIKLYDKKDYFSASIELTKVTTQETGDDAANVQRAQFFMGKTLYQMGFYVPAMGTFDKIAADPKHTYNTASAKWIVALNRPLVMPTPVPGLTALDPAVVDDESLASVRDEARFLIGAAELHNGNYKKAAALLVKVDPSSEFSPRAHIDAAIAYALANDDKSALAEATRVTDATHGERAATIAGWIQLRGKHWDDAIAAFDKAPSGKGAWGAAVARAGKKGTSFAGIDNLLLAPPVVESGLEPSFLPSALAFDGCGKDGALATLRKDAPNMKKELAAILAGADDNTEMFQKHATDLADGTAKGLSARTKALTKAMLGSSPSLLQTLGFVVELNKELELLQKSDKAWQTTQIAADILQELTVQQSVAVADAGKVLRHRVQLLIDALDALTASKADGFVLPCGK